MPAKSIKQQKFFGLLLAYRRGEIPASKVSAYGRKVAKSMTLKQIEEMAKKPISGFKGEKVSKPVQKKKVGLKDILKKEELQLFETKLKLLLKINDYDKFNTAWHKLKEKYEKLTKKQLSQLNSIFELLHKHQLQLFFKKYPTKESFTNKRLEYTDSFGRQLSATYQQLERVYNVETEQAKKIGLRDKKKMGAYRYRIQKANRRILNAGTDKSSWFNLKEARELCNYEKGERIVESDGVYILWEVF